MPGTVLDSNIPFIEEVFNYIKNNDLSGLTNLLLKEGSNCNLVEMRDIKLFTVLSFAAYKNFEDCMMLLFNHAL